MEFYCSTQNFKLFIFLYLSAMSCLGKDCIESMFGCVLCTFELWYTFQSRKTVHTSIYYHP